MNNIIDQGSILRDLTRWSDYGAESSQVITDYTTITLNMRIMFNRNDNKSDFCGYTEKQVYCKNHIVSASEFPTSTSSFTGTSRTVGVTAAMRFIASASAGARSSVTL